jgi:hypothetical protein
MQIVFGIGMVVIAALGIHCMVRHNGPPLDEFEFDLSAIRLPFAFVGCSIQPLVNTQGNRHTPMRSPPGFRALSCIDFRKCNLEAESTCIVCMNLRSYELLIYRNCRPIGKTRHDRAQRLRGLTQNSPFLASD